MKPIYVVYMSISGHVRSFIDRLTAYADEKSKQRPDQFRRISSEELIDEDDVHELDHDFIMFVPTYVSLSPSDHRTYFENSTIPLRQLLNCGDNIHHCRGLVGNGDRFFGPAYCLTSRQYAKLFHVPLLATYESRGTSKDIQNIYDKLMQQYPANAAQKRNPGQLDASFSNN